MKVYWGSPGSPSQIEYMRKNGYGGLFLTYRNPSSLPYFCIDNGAYGAWKANVPWDEERFRKTLKAYFERGFFPDFIAVPDKPAQGYESLEFSLIWVEKLKKLSPGSPRYLVVQDGMAYEDVEAVIGIFDGIFVGGTIRWKKLTGKEWVELAHKYGKLCHIGRAGTKQRIVWACAIDADSIDSSSWVQNHKTGYKHLERAKELLGTKNLREWY